MRNDTYLDGPLLDSYQPRRVIAIVCCDAQYIVLQQGLE